jgi:DNA-binding CsgD family transcriptional regulator
MPHLRQALRLHRRISALETTSDDFAEVLDRMSRAVILVDTHGNVTWTNHAADGLLAARDGLIVDNGQLRAARGADTTRLRTLLAEAAATAAGRGLGFGGALRLGRPSGRCPLITLVAPLVRRSDFFSATAPPVVAVVVTDPESAPVPDQETLRGLFGLTPAEAALTRLLAQGLTLQQAAAHLKLRPATLRTRLKTIFEKTGTHRQADLVRLALLGVGHV